MYNRLGHKLGQTYLGYHHIKSISYDDSLTFDEIIGLEATFVYNITITDNLPLTQTISLDLPTTTIVSKCGRTFTIRTPNPIVLIDLGFKRSFKRITKVAYTFSDTPDKLSNFKQFINYNKSDPFVIQINNKRYTAYLEQNQNNDKYLNIYDRTVPLVLNFDII